MHDKEDNTNKYYPVISVLIACAVILFVAFADSSKKKDVQSKATETGTYGIVKGNFTGCITKEDYHTLSKATIYHDTITFARAFEEWRCFNISGREYQLIDRSWFVVKLRVYVDDSWIELWTAMEALD